MATLERQVSAGSDDCRRRLVALYWNLVPILQIAGAESSSNYQNGGGMRFTNITIPQGATITEAHLTFRCRAAKSGTVCNTRISAEDVDDAVAFADDGDAFDTRWAARTTARVDWDAIPAWTAETDYDSPDIKTVIQEIVDRASWASGNDIVIFWDDFEDRSDHNDAACRDAHSYEGNATYCPKLVITYTPVAVGRSFGCIIG